MDGDLQFLILKKNITSSEKARKPSLTVFPTGLVGLLTNQMLQLNTFNTLAIIQVPYY